MNPSSSPAGLPRRRPAAVAGLFYPDDPEELRREVRGFIRGGSVPGVQPRALIVPHAGYAYSGAVAGSGYRALANPGRRIERVYLLGPAHRVATRGVAAPDHRSFATPLGDVPVDDAVIEDLLQRFDFVHRNADSHRDEHSLEVHLPFLLEALGRFLLVPLVVGDIHPGRLKALTDMALDDDAGLLVVSSDLSHYHAYDEARRIDSATVEAVEKLDWQRLGPERACGFIPLAALLQSAAERGYRVRAVDVRSSGDTAGPHDRVVGYASFVVTAPTAGLDRADRERLLCHARDAIETRLGRRSPRAFADWPARLRRPAATFVTLTLDGQLRGCIGSLVAHRPLHASVAANAAAAAFEDPRFPPLGAAECALVDIAISVLSPSAPIEFADERDLVERLRPGVDGLILRCGGYHGTFLPSVWAQLPQPDSFLRQLKRKAGLDADFWSDDIAVERYTTESFAEGDR